MLAQHVDVQSNTTAELLRGIGQIFAHQAELKETQTKLAGVLEQQHDHFSELREKISLIGHRQDDIVLVMNQIHGLAAQQREVTDMNMALMDDTSTAPAGGGFQAIRTIRRSESSSSLTRISADAPSPQLTGARSALHASGK